MDDIVATVEGAQGELLKYLNSVSSNRWLMVKIFFVLMGFNSVLIDLLIFYMNSFPTFSSSLAM